MGLDYGFGGSDAQPREGLITLTHVIYGLHAFSAVILNYAKRSEVAGSYLDSHFSWQIRTFWYAALWVVVGLVMFATVIGIPLAIMVFIAVSLWILYRIVRGWLSLLERKPMDVPR